MVSAYAVIYGDCQLNTDLYTVDEALQFAAHEYTGHQDVIVLEALEVEGELHHFRVITELLAKEEALA